MSRLLVIPVERFSEFVQDGHCASFSEGDVATLRELCATHGECVSALSCRRTAQSPKELAFLRELDKGALSLPPSEALPRVEVGDTVAVLDFRDERFETLVVMTSRIGE